MSKEKTFKEYLSAMPKQTLTALFYGADSKKIISLSQVVNEICRKFFESSYLEEALRHFSQETASVFKFLLVEGELGSDIPSIHAHLKHLTEEKINQELRVLQSALFIFGVRATPARYFVFKEIRDHLHARFIEDGIKSLKVVKTIKEKKCLGDALFRDVLLFLLFLMREPLRRTKQGALNRKQLEVIVRSFESKMDFAASSEAWPSLFQLIHGFLIKRELIEVSPEEWRISDKGIRFLDMEITESARLFYNHALKENKEEKARLLMSLLKTAEHPIQTEELVRYFYSRSAQDSRPMPEIFDGLFAAGLIQLVQGEHQQAGLMLSERGQAVLDKVPLLLETTDKITLLPTFEIVAPRTLRAGLLRMLFQTCDLEKSDALLTFKLSRESLFKGLDQGLKPEEFLKKLTALTSHQIPQNVLFSLQDWMAAYGSVAFEMHFLLRVKKPELYDKVKGVLSGTRYIAEELPGTGFSIQASDYQEVFSILNRLGYSPKPFVAQRANNEPKRGADILESYMSQHDSSAGNEIDFIFPDEPEEKIKSAKAHAHGKYSGKLQTLPFNELVHVINYAILMENGLELERKQGGSRIRILPRELLLHLSEPLMKGHHPLNGEALEIQINDIEKIRVED